MGDALFIHCEIHNVLATVHPDHDEVGDDDNREEHDNDDEPYFDEPVPDILPVVVDRRRDERDQQWNTEQNTENLEEDI